jgi:hypothetical protein
MSASNKMMENSAVNEAFDDRRDVPNLSRTTVEISVRGTWQTIPALRVGALNIITRGKWLKLAVVHNEEWLETEVNHPQAIVEGLKNPRARFLHGDIFTFSQRLPVTVPKYSYHLAWDSIAAIPVTTFRSWWEELPQVTRKNVRRAQKRGVEVVVRSLDEELIRDIAQLTADSPIRQRKAFVHYGKTFDQTKKDQSTFPGHSEFICAYSGKDLIGLLKLVYGDGIASVLQFLPKTSEQDKRPANALIAKAVDVCEARRIPVLVYGLYNYGNKRHSSLLEFKVRNGFQEFLVPRYYVPLTPLGALCLKLNLHKGIISLLPERVIEAALGLRAKWYDISRFLRRRSSMTEQPNRIRQTERSNPPAGSTQDSEV